MHVRTTLCVCVMMISSVGAQQGGSSSPVQRARPDAAPAVSASEAAATEEVLAFEKAMEAAVVRGDVAFLDRICPADFRFTHGDGWTSGGAPLRVDTKETWLAAVSKQPYLYRTLDSVKVELHSDIAITYGRYKMRQKASANAGEQSVWFERVYAKRNGQWQYLSHRTVHGPLRESGSTSASGR
jgi:hypothetical protein